MEVTKDLSEFPDTKVCSGPCGRELPRTPENFEPCRARTKDGLRNACRDCERQRNTEYKREYRAKKKAEKDANNSKPTA